jgi:hypothetical protein
MLGIYEIGERGSMKGPIEIEQSSSFINIRLIQNNLIFKLYKHTINSKQLNDVITNGG